MERMDLALDAGPFSYRFVGADGAGNAASLSREASDIAVDLRRQRRVSGAIRSICAAQLRCVPEDQVGAEATSLRRALRWRLAAALLAAAAALLALVATAARWRPRGIGALQVDTRSEGKDERVGLCGLVEYDTAYEGASPATTRSAPSADSCCQMCQTSAGCGAWTFGKALGAVEAIGVCFMKEVRPGSELRRLRRLGVISAMLPAVSSRSKTRPERCGLVQQNTAYIAKELRSIHSKSPSSCCATCEGHPGCGAWSWNRSRCSMKEFSRRGEMVSQVQAKGVTSGLPAKTAGALAIPLLNNSEHVDQEEAEIQVGGSVRLFALGASSMLWMTWVEQLHFYLLRLGYKVPLVDARMKPEDHPRSVQTCDNSAYFDRLETARFARIGWCSWDFAYEGWSGCNKDGYRIIGGHRVRCQHGPGCNHSVTGTWASEIAEDTARSDIALVATWFNDDQQKWSDYNCFYGKQIDHLEAARSLSVPSLLGTVRSIHARSPRVWVVVMAKYPQVPGHWTTQWLKEVNAVVKNALSNEPRTLFVEYIMPPDAHAHMYQTTHAGHPNCRGSKLMAQAVLRTLFSAKVLARGLRLREPVPSNIVNFNCSSLRSEACHTSAVCWLDPADAQCKPYGGGSRSVHSP